MDGLLVIDKPAGPSSHDVVARARRVLREQRIGHTGTLDPAATGVLPLVVGRATRLARFLSAGDKTYDAVIRLGVSTTSYDAQGQTVGDVCSGPWPNRDAIEQALEQYRGTFLQQPPAYSAKKVGGHPSYKLARRASRAVGRGLTPSDVSVSAMDLRAVPVTTFAVDLVDVVDHTVSVRIHCGAGFYVRSLAHDLGQHLGTGAHLVALRRTRSGDATLGDALPLAAIENGEDGRRLAADGLIPLSRMMPALAPLALTDEGVRHAGHGRELTPRDFAECTRFTELAGRGLQVRLLDPGGNLIGIAGPARTPGLLHPFLILM